MFSKWFSAKRSPSVTRKPAGARLGVELLEDRVVMSGNTNPFQEMVSLLKNSNSILGEVVAGIDTAKSAMNTTLPIINKSPTELLNVSSVKQGLTSVESAIKQIQTTLDTLSNTQQTEASASQALTDDLNSLLGGGVAKVTVSFSQPNSPLTIDIDIDDTIKVDQGDLKFGLGLPGMPFKADVNGNWGVNVDLGVHKFEIALVDDGQTPASINVNGGHFDIGLSLNASTDTTLEGELGFLTFEAKNQTSVDDGSKTSSLELHFGADITNQGVATPTLDGGADVNLHLMLGIQSNLLSAPNVEADFHLHWHFTNQTDPKDPKDFGDNDFYVGLTNIHMSLGSYLTQTLGPTIQKMQQLTAPVKDFAEFLGKPIPGISDIAKLAGKSDGVSLLDIASVVGGVAGEPYSTYVTLGKTITELTNIINSIDLSDPSAQSAFINLGDFDISAAQQGGTDIRDQQDVTPVFGNADISDWSALATIADSINLAGIQKQLDDLPAGPAHALGQQVNQVLNKLQEIAAGQGAAYYKLDFPILEHPEESIMKVLIGRDADLVTFKAGIDLPTSGNGFGFDLSGVQVGLNTGVSVQAFFEMGYDTRGLREIVSDVWQNGLNNGQAIASHLLDGFYISPETKFHIDGDLSLFVGGGDIIFSGDVQAGAHFGLDSDIPESIANPSDPAHPIKIDKDGDGKLRLDELSTHAFDVHAHATAYAQVDLKVGVELLGVFVGVEFPFTLAQAPIFDFNTDSLNVNPFLPAAPLATQDPSTGDVTLNLAPNQGQPKSISVFHDPKHTAPTGEAIVVSAYGYTQRFDGVSKIIARGDMFPGTGPNSIIIGKDVASEIDLTGGDDNDYFETQGYGVANFDGRGGNDTLIGGLGYNNFTGGAGNDTLVGGLGNNTLDGGDDDDVITGGDDPTTLNRLTGGAGNDVIHGGAALNQIDGGAGADRLFAGTGNDEIHGGTGNDVIVAGPGTDSLYGDDGDDTFDWGYHTYGYDGAVTIDGGAGVDSLGMAGSGSDETYSLDRSGANILVHAPNNLVLTTGNLENVSIEGNGGLDKIHVGDLTATTVQNVTVNSGDVLRAMNNQGDSAVDQVTIDGTAFADNITVSTENVVVGMAHHESLFGGMTKFAGFTAPGSGNSGYAVHVANVGDDVRYFAHEGDDTTTVLGVTGPTMLLGQEGNDTFNVGRSSDFPQRFLGAVTLEAGSGTTNQVHFNEVGAALDPLTLTDNALTSDLNKFPAVTFQATGGSYSQVSLDTGDGADYVTVQKTLASAVTTISTHGGDDQISVQSPSGDLASIKGTLNVDAGTGANNQLLLNDVTAASGNQAVVITSGSVLGFAGPTDATPINYAATGGQLKLVLQASNVSNLTERFQLVNPGAVVELHTNQGDSQTRVDSLTQSATILGGAGTDTVDVTPASKNLGNIQGPLQFIGGAGADTMTASDAQAPSGQTYNLGATSLARSGAAAISFDGTLEKLNVIGTGLTDQMNVTAIPVAAQVNVNMGGGKDTLAGPDAANLFDIQGNNAGVLDGRVVFANVQNVTGGALDDVFLFRDAGNIAGTIQGGTGSDTLDYSRVTSGATANLQTMKATGVNTFAGIENVVGSNTADDEIIAPKAPNVWQVNGNDAGLVQTLAQGNIHFAGIENLTGGTSSDVFLFQPHGQVRGQVDGGGGAGIDRLDYSGLTTGVHVDLTLGTATGVGGGIKNIDDVTGGAGNDFLRGSAKVNHLDGGAGNDVVLGSGGADTLLGGSGRDIITGGAGADQIDGGSDDDILIAGSLTYETLAPDALTHAFDLLMAEWSSAASYAQRRDHLLNGGGLNGTTLLDAAHIVNGVAGNTLTGGSGLDWFWARPLNGDQVVAEAGEKLNAQP